MNDDYLWDRSGPPDPDVDRLEALLARYRTDAERLPPLRLDAVEREAGRAPDWRSWLAAAAVAALAVGAGWLSAPTRQAGEDPWRVAQVEGQPRLGATPLTARDTLTPGRWLDTDASSSAVVFVGRIGRLEVAPGSRLRLVTADAAAHRAELAHGRIEAQIWAPPGQFVIDTPSATAVDLGCAYTLTMGRDGVGLLVVQGGWVGFEHQGRESFVPAGASVRTYPGSGPGIPAFDDASEALRQAVRTLDAAEGDGQAEPIDVILREARPRDALTLWHLLARVDTRHLPAVVDRLHALAPMPAGVTRNGVLTGDRAMLDAWWSALGLGASDWWRTWRQTWNPDLARTPDSSSPATR